MAIEIKLIFEALGLGKQVAEIFGLLDSIGVKLDELAQSELDAGLRALNQAQSSRNETKTLLREARMRFNKAVSLEKNERLAAGWIGLAFCHHSLGDIENSHATLRNVLEISFEGKGMEKAKARAVQGLGGVLFGGLFGTPAYAKGEVMLKQLEKREESLRVIKLAVSNYLTVAS